MDKINKNKYEFIIIGGGIAGTSCAQQLCFLAETTDHEILLLSGTSYIKATTNLHQVTKFLNEFDVEEKTADSFSSSLKNLTVLNKCVVGLDSENHKVICSNNEEYIYNRLCICTGASPKLISSNPFVIGIRDTETVKQFQERLKNARQIIIVGNGGIATELVYEIENCDVIWAIKDDHISHIYFDAHSAKFFDESINAIKLPKNEQSIFKRKKYTISKFQMSSGDNKLNVFGSALGPDWSFDLLIKGISSNPRKVSIEYKCEIKRIISREDYLIENKDGDRNWPVFVELTNGKIIGADFIISATGVVPSNDIFVKNNNFDLAEDGGLRVNETMQTNIKDVYAAGDCCTASWEKSEYWRQMRIWSQASQMGDVAARSMWSSFNNNPQNNLDFCFEMFAHITKFFNFKIILLGNYDAKDLNNDFELLIRCTKGLEYVKVVIHDGRVVGALLIGETELEETFENLILNQINVASLGENLINPDIDIQDYFD